MKITIKGLLLDITEEKMTEIDKLMTIFSSAKRYAFKRLLEGTKKGDLEKDIAFR